MRTELGIERSGLDRLIRAAFELLELITFFTAGTDKDATARTCAVAAPPGTRRGRSTARSRRRSSAPRSSAGRTWSRRAATPPPATAACFGPRAATTSIADGDVITIKL